MQTGTAGTEGSQEVRVRRTDPVYNAHPYLTKVPIAAIIPFIRRYSSPGDTVLDVFAGSGMTGIAAAMAGRRAILVDISELGFHIATNYLNFVDHHELDQAAATAVAQADESLGYPYSTPCANCGELGVLSRSVWSSVYQCSKCTAPIVYFQAVNEADQESRVVQCRECGEPLQRRSATKSGESRVSDIIACRCSTTLREQRATAQTDTFVIPHSLEYPDVIIQSDREMYRRSALARHDLTSTARFFSRRNLAALAALRGEIRKVRDPKIRNKLLFVFTAILSRASKRYQWGPKRPLNAQNQTYYVAPIFLEWNVFDLFRRKLRAIKRSDDYVAEQIGPLFIDHVSVQYMVQSAAELAFLRDESVDYVFTDPPFGGNIFYSDMNLFHEAWLGSFTDRSQEAVIPTNGDRESAAQRYCALLVKALRECFRVLRPGRHLTLVFSNSSGLVWALAQQAIHESGFVLEADAVYLLDKGQRSVKGLSSGYEGVVTSDLVLTMQKPISPHRKESITPTESVEESVLAALIGDASIATPSRLYLEVVRRYLERCWDLSELDFDRVLRIALGLNLVVDPRTGAFRANREQDSP